MTRKWIENSANDIYSRLEWLFDVLWLNILTILMCLPIITFGASVVALYETSEKVIHRREGYIHQAFLKAFKENFKKSTLAWLLLGISITLIQWNAGIMEGVMNGKIRFLFVAFYMLLMLIFVSALIYVLPIMAKFNMNLGWSIKLAFFMTFRYFFTTLLALLVFAICLLIIYIFPISFFILPVFYTLFMNRLLIPKLKLHME